MESKAKVFPQHIQPMLIVFALGPFMAAGAFDMLYLVTRHEAPATVSFSNIVGGIMGVVAGATGPVTSLAGWRTGGPPGYGHRG
jgi:uncharacterized membrane protein